MRIVHAAWLAVIAAFVCSVPPRAEACINPIQMTKFDAVRRIAAVDWLLARDQFWLADFLVPVGKYGAIGYIEVIDDPRRHHRDFEEEFFDTHLVDAQALIDLRWRGDDHAIGYAAYWFELRHQQNTSPRYAAWLAEAYSYDAAKQEQARSILRDLARRDLMPDAHAYATLAKLTGGEERKVALLACYARAAARSVCPAIAI